MKIGIIRCQQTEDLCPGTTDFRVAKEGKGAFEKSGPVDIVGFVSCGGCPGEKVLGRAKMLVSRGAEAIVFASCISKGNRMGRPCQHYETSKKVIEQTICSDIPIIEWTH